MNLICCSRDYREEACNPKTKSRFISLKGKFTLYVFSEDDIRYEEAELHQ